MKNKLAALMVVLPAFIAAVLLHPAVAQDNSSSNPAAVGARVRSMVELRSNVYDIAITVLETVRGNDALVRLKAAYSDNPMPREGFEYVLARVKFELKGRAVSDKLTFQLGNEPLQWVALASDLTEYSGISVTTPKPALSGAVKPGDAMEGWVAFAVESTDSKPVMVFDPDAGGGTGRGFTLFFKLYP